jgi:GNAT superfamily N-acetyltransferase
MMTDMIVKLYALPPATYVHEGPLQEGITIRRAMVFERGVIMEWVKQQFNAQWADECQIAFGRHPVGCHIVVVGSEICGFCCTNCTFNGFLGPIGLQSDFRGKGIGRMLLLTALESMWGQGYAYAVIGNAGHPEFFKRCAGAVAIADSTPGPYPASLKL